MTDTAHVPAPDSYLGTGDPFYTARRVKNRQGVTVLALDFETTDDLQAFFVNQLIGTNMGKKSEHEVIGTTLLIWDREVNQ